MNELPEYRLAVVPTTDAPITESKLGGKPTWIQVEWQPECCGTPMTFLGQIDSLDIQEANLPNSAIIYIFFCGKCFDVSAQLQCC